MTEAAERWSAYSIATAAWPRTWRQPADRGVTWRSQGRWRRARPHRRNSETGSKQNASTNPMKQPDSECFFELWNLVAEGRRSEVHFPRRVHHRARPGDCLEGLERFQSRQFPHSNSFALAAQSTQDRSGARSHFPCHSCGAKGLDGSKRVKGLPVIAPDPWGRGDS